MEEFERGRGSRPPRRRQIHLVLKGLIKHRHHTELPTCPMLPYNIEAKAQSNRPENWHIACSSSGANTSEAQPMGTPAGRAACQYQAGGKGPYGESDTDHQQQELLVLVAAWLAADEGFR